MFCACSVYLSHYGNSLLNTTARWWEPWSKLGGITGVDWSLVFMLSARSSVLVNWFSLSFPTKVITDFLLMSCAAVLVTSQVCSPKQGQLPCYTTSFIWPMLLIVVKQSPCNVFNVAIFPDIPSVMQGPVKPAYILSSFIFSPHIQQKDFVSFFKLYRCIVMYFSLVQSWSFCS